ncbi:Arm DNA-binding domain-containing protein [Acinetobacter schindleri]|uniref:Arm DNA-binding domain-containing protein n=1 Tax=Acinetobacter schindleri TaxID=108981 RepID=UPI002DC04F28|nr:Arm DNA-binding domain-containing protein [Acinetobacter schindleri]MEB5928616.1 Arm DNA-binding domain-containing protein [Acinetobacter schindleri]
MPKLVVGFTDSKIKSAISMQKKAFEKNIKLSDGGGLYLLLDKKGGAYWRFDYVRPATKKRVTIAIGIYPTYEIIHFVILLINIVKLKS